MINVFSFECDIAENCNYSCVGCSHWAPAHKVAYTTPAEMAQDLAHLARVAHANKFCVLGGEPLLHPDLAGILRVVRASGICDLIELWTNGSLLNRQPDEIWLNVDSITVNSYPGKLTQADEDAMRARARVLGVPLEIDHPTHFYHNATRGERKDDIQKWFDTCPYQDHCWAVHHGYLYRCPQSISLSEMLLHIPKEVEGIRLEGVTEEDLRGFLTSRQPRESCKVCARQEVWFPWREEKRKDWLDASLIPVRAAS